MYDFGDKYKKRSDAIKKAIPRYENLVENETRKLIISCIKREYDPDLCVEHSLKNIFSRTWDTEEGPNYALTKDFPNKLLNKFNKEFDTNVPDFNVSYEEHIENNIFEKKENMPFAVYLLYHSNKRPLEHKKLFEEWKKIQEQNVKEKGKHLNDIPDGRVPKYIENIIKKYDEVDNRDARDWWWGLNRIKNEKSKEVNENIKFLKKTYIRKNNLESDKDKLYRGWYTKEREKLRERYDFERELRRRKGKRGPPKLKKPDKKQFENEYQSIVNKRIPREKFDEWFEESKKKVFPFYFNNKKEDRIYNKTREILKELYAIN